MSIKNGLKIIIIEITILHVFTIKRGCTEFTNSYKEYGEIGNLGNLHQGPQQRKEWKDREDQLLSTRVDTIKANPTGKEFNLGELLIIKNWILYALEMNDPTAIAKYGHTKYKNDRISQLITLKKATIMQQGF